MTILDTIGFDAPVNTPATIWLSENGSIARYRKKKVDIILALGCKYLWTQMTIDEFDDIVLPSQRGQFLATTNSSSYREWCLSNPCYKVMDLMYFYDRRIFTDNKPQHTFETLEQLTKFLEK